MRFLSIFLFLITSLVSFGQETLRMDITSIDYKTEKKDPGVTIKVYDGSTVIITKTSDASGRTSLDLPLNKKLKIEFSKAGKVTRFCTVDTKGIDPELLVGNTKAALSAPVGLFEAQPGVDYSSISGEKFTEFYFDGSNMNYDQAVSDRMTKKIDKLLKDSDAQKGAADAQYNAAIKEADAFFTQKKYNEAKGSYEKALGFKPTEAHPNQRLLEIDAILRSQNATNTQAAQAENEYKALIESADNLYNQKKYEEAVTRYKEALTKKQEAYPQTQITKAEAEIARLKAEAANVEKYNTAIQQADGFMKQSSFQAARDKYKEALKYKKDDPYATGKLAELEGKLNAQKAEQDKKKKYDDAVAAADALFGEEKWAESKAKYQEALVMEPSSTYVKAKIGEADAKLAEIEKEKQKQEQITKLIAEGNTAFAGSKWAESKTKFQEVLKLDDKNAVALAKLPEIEAKLADEKANADKIAKVKSLVAEGDALAKTTKLTEAKAKYEEAQSLIPDPAVKAKIDAIDAQMADAAKKAEQKTKYDKAMADGDAAMTAAKYEDAIARYTEAQSLDPAQTTPKTKIAEAQKKIDAAKSAADKDQKYAAALAAGVAAIEAKNYTEAKVKLQEAIALDATKPEAKAKMTELDGLIAALAKEKELETKVGALVKAGDDLAAASKWNEAKAKYTEAQGLKSSPEVAQKIADIDKTLAAMEQDKAAKLAKYNGAMSEGEALAGSGKFAEAKNKFTEAGTIDPSQAAPKQRVADMDKKIAEELAKAEKSTKYQAAYDAGMAAMSGGNLELAKTKFTEAVNIDGTRAEAKSKLSEVESLLAGNAKVAENEKKYGDAVKAGSDLMAAGKLSEAKAKYTEAKGLKPSESLPDQKIAEIDQLLAGKEKQKQIDDALKTANSAFDKKDYSAARSGYQAVLGLDPTNAQATSRLSEIGKLEADQASAAQNESRFKQLKDEGVALMSSANYQQAKQKFQEAKSIKSDPSIDELIKQADARMAEQARGAEAEQRYAAAIQEAQGFESGKKYDEAIAKYTEALTFKNEQMPKDKISALNKMKSENAAQQKIDADYAAAMKKGDDFMQGKEYLKAIEQYNKALAIKPTEREPADKADEAARLEKERSGGDVAAQYQKLLDVAQKSLDDKNYTKAKELYSRAVGLKADDPFPKQKLQEIDALLKAEQDAANKLAAYNAKMKEAEAAVSKKDYQNAISLFENARSIKPDETAPENRIAEVRALIDANASQAAEQEARYAAAMQEGNGLADQKNYRGAIDKYKDALSLKSGDKPATDKIAAMQVKLDELANKEASDAKVKSIIEKADKLFAKSKWGEAKSVYEEALQLAPTNKYAQAQVRQCDENMQSERAGEVEKQYRKLIAKADEKFDAAEYESAKDYYQRAVKMKPADGYPKQRLNEIAARLNKKPVVNNGQPEPLASLGDPGSDSSYARLVQAEIKRQQLKTLRENAVANNPVLSSDSLNALNTQNSILDGVALMEVKRSNSGVEGQLSEDQKVNADGVTQINNALAVNQIQDNTYETGSVQYTDAQLALLSRENSQGLQDLEGGQYVNHTSVTEIALQAENVERENQNSNYQQNLDGQDRLARTRIEVQNQDLNDFEERFQVTQEVLATEKAIAAINDNATDQENADRLAIQESLYEHNVLVANKDAEDAKIAPQNNEELKAVKAEVASQIQENQEKSVNNSLTARAAVETINKTVGEDAANSDDAREANTQEIQDYQKYQTRVELDSYNASVEKSLSTNGQIAQVVRAKSELELAQEKYANDNDARIKDIRTENDKTIVQSNENSTNKVRATQAHIEEDKKANTYSQDPKAANDLGKMYKEGVTEIPFEQKDKEGLLQAVVTRRIVVKQGHGDEYIRTQTLMGVTYTKNGQAITEYTWQKETNDASLQKNMP